MLGELDRAGGQELKMSCTISEKKKKKDFDIVSGFAVLFQYLKRTFGYLYLRHIHYG